MKNIDLDTLFQDEFSYLKLLAQDFSERYPELNDFFSTSAADPGVERLLEGAAFLTARLRQKIDDEFPEITQGLLKEVWSTPLRPLPATSVVEFIAEDDEETFYIPAGAQIKGVSGEEEYLFSIRRDLTVLPLSITEKKATHATDGTLISLSFRSNFTKEKSVFSEPVPLFLSSDQTTAGLLSLWFRHYLTGVTLSSNGQSYPVSMDILSFMSPTPDNLVCPGDCQQFWRLQLLQEYFYFPHVNDFAYLNFNNLPAFFSLSTLGDFTLEFKFSRVIPPECIINQESFRLYCTPIINLFQSKMSAIPFATKTIRDGGHARYVIMPGNKSHRLFSVNQVYSPSEVSDNQRGEIQIFKSMADFIPVRFDTHSEDYFYDFTLEKDVCDEPVCFLSFYDCQGKPVNISSRKHFICKTDCINDAGILNLNVGDINIPGSEIPGNLTFRNITPLSTPYLPQSENHWSVISHLSLSPLLLNDKTTIQHVVNDFDIHASRNFPAHEKHKRYLSGIAQVFSEPIDRLIDGFPVRGLRFDLHLDPDYYPDEGEMYRFGSALAGFFAYCISDSSFITTTLINVQTGECWPLAQIQGTRTQI